MSAKNPEASEQPDVLPTIDVKTHLNTYLKQVRDAGLHSKPIYFGAHRKREAVIISAALYDEMMDMIQIQGELLGSEKYIPRRNASAEIVKQTMGPVFEELVSAIERGERPSVTIDFNNLETSEEGEEDTQVTWPEPAMSPHELISGPGPKVVIPEHVTEGDARLFLYAVFGKQPDEKVRVTKADYPKTSVAAAKALLMQAQHIGRGVAITQRILAWALFQDKAIYDSMQQRLQADGEAPELIGGPVGSGTGVVKSQQLHDYVAALRDVADIIDDIEIAEIVRERLAKPTKTTSLEEIAKELGIDLNDLD